MKNKIVKKTTIHFSLLQIHWKIGNYLFKMIMEISNHLKK